MGAVSLPTQGKLGQGTFAPQATLTLEIAEEAQVLFLPQQPSAGFVPAFQCGRSPNECGLLLRGGSRLDILELLPERALLKPGIPGSTATGDRGSSEPRT